MDVDRLSLYYVMQKETIKGRRLDLPAPRAPCVHPPLVMALLLFATYPDLFFRKVGSRALRVP